MDERTPPAPTPAQQTAGEGLKRLATRLLPNCASALDLHELAFVLQGAATQRFRDGEMTALQFLELDRTIRRIVDRTHAGLNAQPIADIQFAATGRLDSALMSYGAEASARGQAEAQRDELREHCTKLTKLLRRCASYAPFDLARDSVVAAAAAEAAARKP